MKVDLKVGDKVELLDGGEWGTGGYPPPGTVVNVVSDESGYAKGDNGAGFLTTFDGYAYSDFPIRKVEPSVSKVGVSYAPTPTYYDFPGGVQVRDISAHLTSFGGQALQYVARATRLDGNNKGEAVGDLRKAIDFIGWEIERLEAGSD